MFSASYQFCIRLTVYELHRRLDKTSIRVNAFNPGMVPGTGLARTYPAILRFMWKNFMPVLTYIKKDTNTARKSGINLANIAFANELKKYDGLYFNGDKPIKSSSDSYNTNFQKDLWQTSVKLTGIKQQETSISLAYQSSN